MESVEPGINADTNDLSVAVETISKLSSGRILPYFEQEIHGDINKITIPVKDYNPSDRKDTAMRRYMQDWLKLRFKSISVDTRFEQLPAGTSYYTEDQEFPVLGSIVITWWPKKEEGDYEEWKRKREEARKK